MSKEKPDHHDAELVLKVYDLRREAVMRQARDAIIGKFWPRSFEELSAITRPEHSLNAAFRQVISYWEMVYGFVRHGVVHPEFFMESNNGEGLFLFARVLPHLERFRKEVNPKAFGNTEWVSQNTEAGKRMIEQFKKRVEVMSQAAAAK